MRLRNVLWENYDDKLRQLKARYLPRNSFSAKSLRMFRENIFLADMLLQWYCLPYPARSGVTVWETWFPALSFASNTFCDLPLQTSSSAASLWNMTVLTNCWLQTIYMHNTVTSTAYCAASPHTKYSSSGNTSDFCLGITRNEFTVSFKLNFSSSSTSKWR